MIPPNAMERARLAFWNEDGNLDMKLNAAFRSLSAAWPAARREALEEAAVVASAKLHMPEGTYIEPKFDNYKGGLRDAAQTIAVRLRAMAKHGGTE